jgi:uncharacterized membrane protein YjjP (DUF1212 family)
MQAGKRRRWRALPEKMEQLLELGLYAGSLLLGSGAEIYRVENTIYHLLSACGASGVDCIATPTAIHLSAHAYGQVGTRVRRIEKRSTNLGRVAAINTLSRSLSGQQNDPLTVLERLQAIESMTERNLVSLGPWAAALGGTAFATLFGARGWELPSTALVAWLVFRFSSFLRQRGIPSLLTDFICGFLAGLSALTLTLLLPEMPHDRIILGAIMSLVPGVLLTSGVRDVLAGDLLSGIVRTNEALFTAAALAAGVGAILGWWIR